MDASSLAVVMSPNLTGPPLNILCPMNHTLKMHTAIVKLLIESSHLVGCVPPDIAEKRLLESHSLGSVVGAERGEEVELPERYRKRRKQRTASISGGVWLCVCVLCVCVCVCMCVWVCVCVGVCVWVWVCYMTCFSPMAGLVLGIGNRLRSKTSGRVPSSPPPASPSQDRVQAEYHPGISRRTSFKRKALESSENLPTVSKR